MTKTFIIKPLGAVLQRAGLVTHQQIEIALREQAQSNGRRIGELLAWRGWLKPETADFFAERWPEVVRQEGKQLLGQHLKQAGLLNEEQIGALLKEQEQTHLRFGVLAVLKGWVKQATIDFFLEELDRETKANNLEEKARLERELNRLGPYAQIKLRLLQLEGKASSPYRLLAEVISWTNNEPFLTQKLGQLTHESESFIADGEEAAWIEQLVRTRLIENWETQAAGEHLKEIRTHLLNNQQCEPLRLLRLYQEIWQEGEVPAKGSEEQVELVNLGLVTEEQGKLRVANRIYAAVFNPSWIEAELAKMIQPSKLASGLAIQNPPLLSLKPGSIDNSTDSPGNKTARMIVVLLILLGATAAGLQLLAKSREGKMFQEGNELLNKGIYKNAIAKYEQVLNINANYYQAWTNRGYALAGLQEYGKMLGSCVSATIVEPQAVYAWNCQGEALHNLQQYGEAIAAFDSAIAIDPKNSLFWINKTESLLALKRTDEALATINQAIQLLQRVKGTDGQEAIDRELAVALSHQGKALSQNQEYGAALTAYDRAIGYEPGYFPAQRGRGIALQGLRQYDEAVAQFNQMLDNPKLTRAQKAETWYYLGLTFCECRRISKARAAFGQALTLKPDYLAAEEARKHCPN
jgi:tetratricopeptide (TPR) repeat protein